MVILFPHDQQLSIHLVKAFSLIWHHFTGEQDVLCPLF